MANPVIQTSFASGEWAPELGARVDLAKYHAAAATLKNFFVDYRGGASSRMGTKYVLQAYKSNKTVRTISFQASFTVGYILEFGDGYLRFHTNGSPVLESTKAITGATQGNPCQLAIVAHGYNTGDWIFVASVGGMTQLNQRFFQVVNTGANTITLQNILDGSNVDSTAYTAYTAGGTAARVYTLQSPYAAADLLNLKFTQNINFMVLTHTSYVPYVLTLISANNWTLVPLVVGSTISAPTGMGAATTGGGAFQYSYVVTAVDFNGQESNTSAVASSTTNNAIQTITVSWTAVSGAQSYNVYRAGPSTAAVPPAGSAFGFVSNVTGVAYADATTTGIMNAPADYTTTIPIARNPFQGAGVASATVTAAGVYTVNPTLTFAAAPAGGTTATGTCVLQAQTIAPVAILSNGQSVGDSVRFPNGVIAIVSSVNGAGGITGFQALSFPGSNRGSSTGTPDGNPVTGVNSGGFSVVTANVTWGVGAVIIVSAGSGYLVAPAITFSAGAATATAVLQASTAGNPGVTGFFDQRLCLGGLSTSPQELDFSQPGSYYNFNVSNPLQADDAIKATLVSGKLNTIKSLTPMSQGLIVLGDINAWLVNGGGAGASFEPATASAQTQAYNGSSDLPPIVVNFDLLYTQAKGAIVRDLTFNFYTNIYTGVDVSVLSSHLFFGFTLVSWAYSEEPFKLIWAVRSDGTMLSLTFSKEQELIGWAQHTTNGAFVSNATVVEQVSTVAAQTVSVDAHYVLVQRVINGTTVKYIERMADRFLGSYNDTSIWCVDAGLQYNSAPATTFTGMDHLIGANIVGLADGVPFTATVSATGSFTLGTAASVVTAGLQYTPQLKTLTLDLGEPTVQGKVKKIPAVTVRVAKTLGLSIGSFSSTIVAMKDLVRGNVATTLVGQPSQQITDLVTGDAYTKLDPTYNIPGQYFFQQNNPYPVTILGVIPEVTLGDTAK